jgi:HD superfamily phosphodiesterase
VARYAERICREENAHPVVTTLAAYLHDIGIKEAERKYGSASAEHQHQEGPPVAREILEKLGAEEGIIEEVCDIVGHHHTPRTEETVNFKVIYDADLIVNLEEKQKESPSPAEHLAKVIEKSFLTKGGREIAEGALLNG